MRYDARHMERTDFDEKEIDANILPLVNALNAFDGVTTIGSCGGHANPDPQKGQWAAGEWFVNFELEHSHFQRVQQGAAGVSGLQSGRGRRVFPAGGGITDQD